jgi:hypothetical protein
MAAPVEVAAPPPEAAADPSDPSGVPVDAFGVPRGNLFATYNPHGAAGGLFAPAYIQGYAPSEKAVADWNATKGGLTHEMIAKDLLMPEEWKPPQQEQTRGGGMTDVSGNFPGDGVYGGSNIPRNLVLGKNANGSIDVEALRALSHGTPYDVGARRDAIAARMLSNQQAQDAWNNRPQPKDMTRGDAWAAEQPTQFYHPPDEHGGSGWWPGVGDW